MKNLYKKLRAIRIRITLVAISVVISSSFLFAADPGIPDTIRIGCPFRIPHTPSLGDTFRIPVYIWNDEPVGLFTFSFKHDSPTLEFVDWNIPSNSVIPPFSQTFAKLPVIAVEDSNIIRSGWMDISGQNPIPATSGDKALLIGYLAMVVRRPISTEFVQIDTVHEVVQYAFQLDDYVDEQLFTPAYSHCGSEDIVVGTGECGDFNMSGLTDISDVVYLINYIFSGGFAPFDSSGGDIDCGGNSNLSDAVYLINYIFASGPAPCYNCK